MYKTLKQINDEYDNLFKRLNEDKQKEIAKLRKYCQHDYGEAKECSNCYNEVYFVSYCKICGSQTLVE